MKELFRQFWAFAIFKTSLRSVFREIFNSRFSSHLPKQQYFLSLPSLDPSYPTWVINMGQAVFCPQKQNIHPTLRCRDCTIAFRNCKSFLPKRNCRRTASIDTTWRQLTIRSDQLEFLLKIILLNIIRSIYEISHRKHLHSAGFY